VLIGNLEMIGRLALAAVLGSVVGLERQRLLWAAGLRTHMLVCVGACLFMLVSAFGFGDVTGQSHVVLDPSRVAAQVVSGIGFLGAGTILLRGERVKGLTTAASLWAVAAIGLASGGGLYVPAFAATAIVLAILGGVKPLEERWQARLQPRSLRIVARAGALSLESVQEAAGLPASRIRQFILRPADAAGCDEIQLALTRLSPAQAERVARILRAMPEVESVAVEPD
jgi:putative Mg2+ transporter-C (MgtC) family protein